MDGEFLFSVANSTATAATPMTLAEAGLRERDHLQEWVIAHPEILGPNVLIITSEFDRWQSRSGPERHRPDVIGLDADGYLIVVELKRDAAPDTVDMQAIKYAATASRFDVDTLAEVHADYLTRTGGDTLTSEQAKEKTVVSASAGVVTARSHFRTGCLRCATRWQLVASIQNPSMTLASFEDAPEALSDHLRGEATKTILVDAR
jgi:hypothetical protein